MKKLLLLLAIVAGGFGANNAHAQRTPHAIGVHFGGSTIDLGYQYHFSQRNFLDVSAGIFDLDDGFALQAVYNWNIKQWRNWTPRFGTWKLWGGFGGGIGFYDDEPDDGMFFGPVGTLGFGFTIKPCPLTFGVEYRPMVAFNVGNDFDIIDRGFRNIGVTLSYRF